MQEQNKQKQFNQAEYGIKLTPEQAQQFNTAKLEDITDVAKLKDIMQSATPADIFGARAQIKQIPKTTQQRQPIDFSRFTPSELLKQSQSIPVNQILNTKQPIQQQSHIEKISKRIPADWGEFSTAVEQITDFVSAKTGIPYTYRDKIKKRVIQRLIYKGYAPPMPPTQITKENIVDDNVLFTKLKLANMVSANSIQEMNQTERKIFDSYKTTQIVKALDTLKLINEQPSSQNVTNPLLAPLQQQLQQYGGTTNTNTTE